MKTSFIKNFIKGVKIGFDKHSPEILIGLGIASAITSTVLAVKATPKAMDIVLMLNSMKMDVLDGLKIQSLISCSYVVSRMRLTID